MDYEMNSWVNILVSRNQFRSVPNHIWWTTCSICNNPFPLHTRQSGLDEAFLDTSKSEFESDIPFCPKNPVPLVCGTELLRNVNNEGSTVATFSPFFVLFSNFDINKLGGSICFQQTKSIFRCAKKRNK